MDWIIQSSFSMQSYGKQLSLFYDQYQSFIPPNPNLHKWKEICEYTQADTLSEWGPNEHFLEYHCLSFTPPNPTLSHQFKLESRQRSNFTAAIFFFGPIFVCNHRTELVFAGFLTLVILQSVLARALKSHQIILISWFSCFSRTSSLLCSLMSNGHFGPNLGILSDLLFCS